MINRKILMAICFLSIFLICTRPIWLNTEGDLLKDNSKNTRIKNPESSSPTQIDFSTNPGNPSIINVDEYYRVTNGGEDTIYLEVFLTAGEVYLIYTYDNVDELYLYHDSGYSIEIRYSDVWTPYDYISFAPSTSNLYYIKIETLAIMDEYLGVFQAIKYTEAQVEAGVSITFNNIDWGWVFIYFPMLDTSSCNDESDLDLSGPTINPRFRKIEANSDEAYGYNQMGIGNWDFKIALYNNPGSGFIALYSSEGTFRIQVPSSPPPDSITIENPIDTTIWQASTSQAITWIWDGSLTHVDIRLYKGGIYDQTIIDSTANVGTFLWTIPISLTPSSDYSIKINSTDVFDDSEQFTITSPPPDFISIINPNSLSVWYTGSSYSITWSATPSITQVTIKLYKGASFIQNIIEDTSNDGTHTWAIPSDFTSGADYWIRIEGGGVFDECSYFTIEPPPSNDGVVDSSDDGGSGGSGSETDSSASAIPGFPIELLILELFISSLAILILIKKKIN